jgi:hypothetical protein
MERTRTLRRAVAVVAVVTTMTVGAGCRQGDDAARIGKQVGGVVKEVGPRACQVGDAVGDSEYPCH